VQTDTGIAFGAVRPGSAERMFVVSSFNSAMLCDQTGWVSRQRIRESSNGPLTGQVTALIQQLPAEMVHSTGVRARAATETGFATLCLRQMDGLAAVLTTVDCRCVHIQASLCAWRSVMSVLSQGEVFVNISGRDADAWTMSDLLRKIALEETMSI
jgi:hypothetical protein